MALFVVDLDILMFCLPRCVKSERGKKVTRKFCRGRLVDFVVRGVVVFIYNATTAFPMIFFKLQSRPYTQHSQTHIQRILIFG